MILNLITNLPLLPEAIEQINQDGRKRSLENEGNETAIEPCYKRCRFEAMPDEAANLWELPTEMGEYVNRHMTKFINEKTIVDTVLLDNPVPPNITKPFKMDDFFRELLDERRRKSELSLDSVLEKIQQKTVNVFGPLSKVWLAVENALASKDNQPQISLEDMAQQVEQTILLLGQTFNALTYQRRLSALSAVMLDHKKAQATLKEQSHLLEDSGACLFGKSFRKHVVDTAKAKKESKEVYGNRRPDVNKRPFRKGPSFQRENGGRTAVFSRGNSTYQNKGGKFVGGYNNNYNRSQGSSKGFNGKKEFQEGTFLQHGFSGKISSRNTRLNSLASAGFCSSSDKKLVSKAGNTEIPISRKTAVFYKKLAVSDKQPRNFGMGVRFKNSISGTAKTKSPTHTRHE